MSVPHAKLTKSVLATLAYSDHFSFPLTKDEIYLRLVGARSSRPLLIQTLNKMIKSSLLQKTGDYYHLPGRRSLVPRRLGRAKTSAPILARAKTITCELSNLNLPILAIYLTGSLAMANSVPDSDIDFMIITQNGRLWTTRLLLTIYTSLLGLRRTPHSTHNSGKLCLNLYLTPLAFSLPPIKQSLYTAYELIQAVPLYDPSDTRSALLAANPWIHNFLPTVPKRTLLNRNSRLQAEKGPAAAGRRVLNVILNFLESLCYHLQLSYMKSKLTREYVTKDSAFFHPLDPSKEVLRKINS